MVPHVLAAIEAMTHTGPPNMVSIQYLVLIQEGGRHLSKLTQNMF